MGNATQPGQGREGEGGGGVGWERRGRIGGLICVFQETCFSESRADTAVRRNTARRAALTNRFALAPTPAHHLCALTFLDCTVILSPQKEYVGQPTSYGGLHRQPFRIVQPGIARTHATKGCVTPRLRTRGFVILERSRIVRYKKRPVFS